MAKIDLNRERGVRVTNKPSGGLDYNFGGVYAGINAQQKANDALAKGMNHVGRVLTGIYDDMAATRNRQETLAGETAYFDIQEQTNQKILQQIEAGEFDGAGGQDKFREACEKAQNANNERFLKWCDKNASTDEVQDMLILRSKQADARNFAHLGGVMARHAVHLTRTTAEDGIARGIENMDKGLVGLWVDSLEEVESPELREARYSKACSAIDERKLALLRGQLGNASNPDDIDKVWNYAKEGGAYNGVSAFEREKFDIFAISARNGAIAGEAKKAAKDLDDKLGAAKAGLGVSRMEAVERASVFVGERIDKIVDGAANKDAYMEKVESILSESGWTEEKKAIEREKALAAFEDNKTKLRRGIEAKFREQAENVLKTAVEGGGEVPSDTLGDWEYIRAKREIYGYRDEAKMTPEQKAKRSQDFFGLVLDASRYSPQTDPAGVKLAALIKEAQCYPENRSKQLMRVLYDAQFGSAPNAKWSADDTKEFNKQFEEICLIGKGQWTVWGDDDVEDGAAYLDMRNRVLNAAKARGLSLSETLNEMKEDPFYKHIFDINNQREALKFIQGVKER